MPRLAPAFWVLTWETSDLKSKASLVRVRPFLLTYNPLMTSPAHELLQKALALSESERAELAGNLIASLEAAYDADVDVAWQEEVTRRSREVASGRVKTVAWESALEKGQSLLDGE